MVKSIDRDGLHTTKCFKGVCKTIPILQMLAYTIGDDHHVPLSNGCIGIDVQAPTYTKAAYMTQHHVPTASHEHAVQN